MVNKVFLMGRIGKEPESKATKTGLAMCNLTLATNKKNRDGTDTASWHTVKTLGKTAEACLQYVRKGSTVFVEGELTYHHFEKDGRRQTYTSVLANQVKFVGGGAKKSDNVSGALAEEDIPF